MSSRSGGALEGTVQPGVTIPGTDGQYQARDAAAVEELVRRLSPSLLGFLGGVGGSGIAGERH